MKQDPRTVLATGESPAPLSSTDLTPITVAMGDGIGPEIMQATLDILAAAKARIAPETISIGQQMYAAGHSAGIAPEAWDSLRRTKVFLKAPITTPSGGGFKSLNVTIRKSLGLYANVRPCTTYAPFVRSQHPGMDVVIIRENEEDLYAGIEHRQTADVYQCLKLITRPGCERIVRYAFEYARAHGRRKVTCMVKDNIMKLTDGLFYEVFEEIGKDYPDLEKERYIIDIGAARLATQPERFDVIVTTNLYGDIISDIAAEVSGSVGLAGSANIGNQVAMFEAIHGSAPDIAGQDVANPSGLLLGAVQMLIHIGQADVAQRIHNAWLRTLEDGQHTADMCSEHSQSQLGTQAFAKAVITRLGQEPQTLTKVEYDQDAAKTNTSAPVFTSSVRRSRPNKALVGVDVFVDAPQTSPEALGQRLSALPAYGLTLQMITNRGVKVWPGGMQETHCTDHWRCRFMAKPGHAIIYAQVLQLLGEMHAAGVDIIKTENLCEFDAVKGYSMGQGQ